ncbi:MAG: GNAT family N-acetyltransferase [Nitrospirae bacterium]|uniref:GNAT family N-acetyltransferase n=1 Tax=Candidatus Magnetobacterium casense TaxID=1455061 RepID=UPI00058ADA4D|nr:GNAT family N-acetyltransferase [Candidatus Magnetobacterium casensis]MBF0337317.1 GNAT family N-acetyltransferase [Nitrospirota bacterium]
MIDKFNELIALANSKTFLNKKNEPFCIRPFDKTMHEALIETYLAYEPKNSFNGLPPIAESACIQWVNDMVRSGLNVLAFSVDNTILGHAALFTVSTKLSEFFVAVSSMYQNIGIGTQLTRSVIDVSNDLGFDKIWLSVASSNLRAMHVYLKCGFDYISKGCFDDMEMILDLDCYRKKTSQR